MDRMEEIKQRSAELCDLHHIMALMQWDQEVSMPRQAAEGRARQFATISGLVHRKEVDAGLGCLLEAAWEERDGLSVADAALVRVMRRSYEQSTKLPEDFVVEFARLTSQAQTQWVAAREKSDFSLFGDVLARLVAMCRRQADYLGYEAHPYDALLDLYEEGLTTAACERMFAQLKEPLVALVAKWRERWPALDLREPLARENQERFARHVLQAMGFDFSRGLLARSAHPFTTTLGHHDRRITNRYSAKALDFVFGALHEGGHALYEQGIGAELARSHLDDGVSLGIHESQSRLWENIVGRSRPFWQKFYPELQHQFPAQFAETGLGDFLRGINRVAPGLIRVDSDEASYNLHVLIRFEIEKALIAGEIAVADLPALWNERYEKYLGVTVDSDANGVLQDIHWSHGSFGYFPTYTIGNLAAAQIWKAYQSHDPDAAATIASGDFARIRGWLTERIYRHGSIYPPKDLLLQVTGQELAPESFLDSLAQRFSELDGQG